MRKWMHMATLVPEVCIDIHSPEEFDYGQLQLSSSAELLESTRKVTGELNAGQSTVVAVWSMKKPDEKN